MIFAAGHCHASSISFQVKSSQSQVKIFYSGKYTLISYNIGKTETHLGLFVPL